MKKLFGALLAAVMFTFSGAPIASAEADYLIVDEPVEAGDVLVDEDGDVYVVVEEEVEEEPEEILIVDEPVESGDVLVTESGDVYVVQ